MVCLEDFAADDKVNVLMCFHIFHSACVAEWLKGNNDCPVCKFDVTTTKDNVITAKNGKVLHYSKSLGSKEYIKSMSTQPNESNTSFASTVSSLEIFISESPRIKRRPLSEIPQIIQPSLVNVSI